MKVIVDDKIPYIREAIARVADEVVYLPGSAITSADVRDADALIVRTRTRCTSDAFRPCQNGVLSRFSDRYASADQRGTLLRERRQYRDRGNLGEPFPLC